MIKLKCSLWIALMLSVVQGVSADDPIFAHEVEKVIEKSFDVNSDAMIGVHNKYGTITINTWDKNEVDVHVAIKVKSNDRSKADRFLEGVQIEFSESRAKLGMKTIYPELKSSSWWGMSITINQDIDYEVNYTLIVPVGASTHLINKYGNIIQESIDGSCNVTNKYGDVFLGNIGNGLTLDLGYGKSKISDAGNAEMVVKYSKVQIQKCNQLDLTSKYSNYKIGECGDMRIESKYDGYKIVQANSITNDGRYDDFEIGTLGRMDIETRYTDINIDYLETSLNFDGRYGNIKVLGSGDLERFKVGANYTDCRLGVDCNYNFKCKGKYTSISIKAPYDSIDEQSDGNYKTVTAQKGRKGDGADIDATMSYGSFVLKPNR